MKNIPVAKPQIGDNEINNVLKVIKSGHLAEGVFSKELEEKIARFTGAKHAITVVNGTAALHLALEAAGFKPGDEIITTAFTFIASANSIAMIGAVPRFADIDPDTWTIDPESIRKTITDKTKGILPVHIFGLPSDMRAINEIADEHDLIIIEDAAQSHGGKIDGKHTGRFGLAGCFSLFATKNIMTGEGGLIITDDSDFADRCKSIKNHGRAASKYGGYKHFTVGYNYRMTDMAAAIGSVQMDRLPDFLKIRSRNVSIYRETLEDYDNISFQEVKQGVEHANYICGLLTSNKKPQYYIEKLREQGIGSRTIYDTPVYRQPAYKNIKEWRWAISGIKYPDYTNVNLPVTEKVAANHFEIPVHPGVSEESAKMIAGVMKKLLSER
ncbi:MAG: DegT/DnrJ/EryC1/StrS family aminotransferase [Candidatus Hodarchaeales archaeon]